MFLTRIRVLFNDRDNQLCKIHYCLQQNRQTDRQTKMNGVRKWCRGGGRCLWCKGTGNRGNLSGAGIIGAWVCSGLLSNISILHWSRKENWKLEQKRTTGEVYIFTSTSSFCSQPLPLGTKPPPYLHSLPSLLPS